MMRLLFATLALLLMVDGQSITRAAEPRSFDVVVYSATPAGVCAAVAARREGATVALIEPMGLVGGIMSSGLGFSDSNQMARECLRGLFEEFHELVEKAYIAKGVKLPYSVRVKDQTVWTYEPHVAEAVFNDMLREANVEVFLKQDLRSIVQDGVRIKQVITTGDLTIAGRVFIDASYEGDLMAKAKVGYKVGREGRAEFGESLAGLQYPKKEAAVSPFDSAGKLLPLMTGNQAGDPAAGDEKIMTYSFRLCLTSNPNNRVAIVKPNDYDPARFELFRREFAKSPGSFPLDLYPIPGGKLDGNNGIGKQLSIGLVGASWEWPDATPKRRQEIWQDHQSYTQGLIWFAGNDPGVPEATRKRVSKLGLAKDEFANTNYWPPVLYVREARRMRGEYVLTQADILKTITKSDSIGVGSFPIDSHDCQRLPGKDGGFVNEGTIFPVRFKERAIGQPHQLPYRSLLPKLEECDNLLVPVCLSATHVALCSVRVEPTWMVLGQSSGIAAALIARSNVAAQRLPYEQLKPRLLAAKQWLELPAPIVRPADPVPKAVVQQIITAAGGEDKLLKLFRIKERLSVSADPKAKGSERVSVLEPPQYWWVGKKERVKEEKEPATFLVWAWTLGVLTDPKSMLETIPEVTESDKPAFGLRVSGSIDPPMDLYFDKTTNCIVRIDWRADIHRFSEWKDHDGVKYPSKSVGTKKATGKAWYFSEILELERLKELPEGLKR